MNDILHFQMERHADAGVYYVISGIEIALTTEGNTIDEALRNLREAVELYFEGDILPRIPRLLVNGD